MNKDIRLAVSFRRHRKRKRLTRILGVGATDYLIDLWLSVAESCPSGILSGWDDIDIADAAGWEGDPANWVDALIECRFLELSDGVYRLHDWEDHQGWVVNAPARIQAARKAAQARWDKRNGVNNAKNKSEQCESMRGACEPHTKGNAPNPTPSPSPSPSPNPSPTPMVKKHSPSSEVESEFDMLANFERAWKTYPRKQGKKEALRHYRATVKDDETAKRFMSALANYKTHIETEKIEPRFIKSGGTFFNNWQDEAWTEPQAESPSGQFRGAI